MTLRIGSLFSGYGGLDMAVQEVLGGELAWVCDYAAGPSKLLAYRRRLGERPRRAVSPRR